MLRRAKEWGSRPTTSTQVRGVPKSAGARKSPGDAVVHISTSPTTVAERLTEARGPGGPLTCPTPDA